MQVKRVKIPAYSTKKQSMPPHAVPRSMKIPANVVRFQSHNGALAPHLCSSNVVLYK